MPASAMIVDSRALRLMTPMSTSSPTRNKNRTRPGARREAGGSAGIGFGMRGRQRRKVGEAQSRLPKLADAPIVETRLRYERLGVGKMLAGPRKP